jgi:hypothetical protein
LVSGDRQLVFSTQPRDKSLETSQILVLARLS